MNRTGEPDLPGEEDNGGSGPGTRSGPKLERLLSAAAGLMASRGYGQTSIRDVARETGFSLAGMYYYFENKEDLLFQIQQRTFSSLLAEQEAALAGGGGPEERLRQLVRNHLSFFTRHSNELRVCTFELQSLQGERYRKIEALRRRYFRYPAEVIREILELDGQGAAADLVVRHYTLFIFGMLNWIFMWYDAERDAPAEKLGDEMMELVMNGLNGVRAAGG